MRFSIRGIQARFSLVVVLALVSALGVLYMLVDRERRTLEGLEDVSRESISSLVSSTIKSNTQATVAQLADSMGNPLYYMDLDTIGAVQATQRTVATTKYILVFDKLGRIIHDGTEDIARFGLPQADALAPKIVASPVPLTLQDGNILDFSAPIMVGEEKIGGVRVGVNLSEVKRQQDAAIDSLHKQMQARIRTQELAYILAALVAVLIGTVLLWYVNRRMVSPLRRLAQATEQYKGGQFVQIPDDGNTNEIGTLTRSFNRMGRNLELYSREIRNMAFSDTLTGLANRTAFRGFLEEAMRPNDLGMHQVTAVLFFDIDHFKRINDTYGHFVGDEVLKYFAARILRVMDDSGSENAMLARFGGDEFVIGWPLDRWTHHEKLDEKELIELEKDATRLANNILRAFEEPVEAGDERLVVETSIGISIYPDGKLSPVELIKRADSALYIAKDSGKRCFRFHDKDVQQHVMKMQQIETDLEGAWKRGEITVAYQPISRLEDGVIVAVEALLRWSHPEEGRIDPSVFIGMAEASGLIDVLGKEMMLQACMDVAGIKRALPGDYHLAVTVNVSALQLRDGLLPSLVTQALTESGLEARFLSLELTESAVLEYAEVVERQLSRLRQMGCEIWLDDFGTGYSGLSQLRRVRVNGVKIDRSFITDILTDKDDLALTTAIIEMARLLEVQVVAEGIEHPRQLALLRERGCEFGQGFYLARPMDAKSCREFILARHLEHEALQHPKLL